MSLDNKKWKKKKSLGLKLLAVFLVLVLALGIGSYIYLIDYSPAQADALNAMATAVTDTEITGDELLIWEPATQETTTGLIFYPGGKVEAEAYAPLMEALSKKGILCIVAKMPFNLAVFNGDAADGIQESYPQIENWYLGGHSLGGVMASSYIADHADDYAGLLLLASYSTTDLSRLGLDILSIYGSEDQVLNAEAYENAKSNLGNFQEEVIEGGCHAYFGDYGAQDGDGTPTISREEQINQTVLLVYDWMT